MTNIDPHVCIWEPEKLAAIAQGLRELDKGEYYSLQAEPGGPRCVVTKNDVLDMLGDMDEGSSYIVTRLDMTHAEFAKLPEFEGF